MERKERISLIVILLTIGVCLASVAQTPVFFINESSRIENNFSSDIALAVADVNNDYRDDLIRVSQKDLVVHAQLNNGRLFKEQFLMDLPFDVTTVNIGNLNAINGNDIFISGIRKGFLSVELNATFDDYNLVQELDGNYYAQGSNIHDINMDGALDVFVTNDIGFNQTFINDNTGQLSANDEIIDFQLFSEEESAGNYNGIWFDADQDNDLDLFVSKCFATANTNTDVRRINQLYINENGSFVEKAKEFGLDHGDQTWCADSGDFDNDGDIDLVIINHNSPSMVLENTGQNKFITHDVFSSNGMIESDDIQVTVADYNNDGLIDICIAGEKSLMLLNKSNLQFEAYNNTFGFGNMTSMATGDLNDDGWLDILSVYGNASFDFEDRLHMNIGGTNKSLTLSLKGNQSNVNGIGAKIEIYNEDKKQTRWVKSGVAYGVTNTLNVHFGLNDFNVTDSLICYWPSGIVDKYYNLESNNHYIISESECLESLININPSNDIIDCSNETISIETDSNEDVIWNSNIIGNNFETLTSGYFNASSFDNCFNVSNLVFIDTIKALIQPELTFSGDLDLCLGDDFLLSTKSDQQWSWLIDDDLISLQTDILVDKPGTIRAFSGNGCDTLFSEKLTVNYLNVDIESKSDTITTQSDIILNIQEGDIVEWFDSDQFFLSEGRDLEISNIETDTQFYFKIKSFPSDITFDSVPDVYKLNTSYASNQLVGGLAFRVNSECLIKSVLVETDTEGVRNFLILNSSGDTVFNMIKDLNLGVNELELDVGLTSGDYRILTDKEFNLASFGFNSPRLSSGSAVETTFPISINAYVDIEFSLSGLGDFSQFYNWVIEPKFETCESGFIPYKIVLDSTVSNVNIENLKLKVFPNPFYDYLNWESQENWDRVVITDNKGINIKSVNVFNKNTISLESLSQGLYFIRFMQTLIINTL